MNKPSDLNFLRKPILKRAYLLPWTVLLLLVMGLDSLSTADGFIPEQSYLQVMAIPSYLFAVLLSVPIILHLIQRLSNPLKQLRTNRKQEILYLFVPIILFFFLSEGILNGIPFFLHQLSNKKEQMEYFHVNNKNGVYSSSRSFCDGAIHVNYPENDSRVVCGFSRSFWQEVKQGDTIQLFGEQSYWGFQYFHYEQISNQKNSTWGQSKNFFFPDSYL